MDAKCSKILLERSVKKMTKTVKSHEEKELEELKKKLDEKKQKLDAKYAKIAKRRLTKINQIISPDTVIVDMTKKEFESFLNELNTKFSK